MTQLLETLETWTTTIDEAYSTDCIYLDFAKAFDKVPHERLLQKLSSYGINGNMHSWVRSFLTGRKQRVTCNGAYSKWQEVLSGISQGSVLGLILFVLYVNDMPEAVQSTIKLFADDTKVFRGIKSTVDFVTLQEDLNQATSYKLGQEPGNCLLTPANAT